MPSNPDITPKISDGSYPESLPLLSAAAYLPPATSGAVTQVVEFVMRHYASPISMQDLVGVSGVPANSLTRIFNRHYGMSPKRWVWYFRTVLAARLLASKPESSIAAVWKQCGFASAAHFSRRFREVYRESPTEWRTHLQATGTAVESSLTRRPQFRRLALEAETAATSVLQTLGKS